ncbi:ATP-binding cassette domain-containing protein [Mycoplasma sp. P36-A1]|uniref:ATP-binding cassette domain-containing protein n=1 Tax=Mycoplasma sp. P36-A1 TaxID=3252900 RepID=UPI003C2D4E20
MIVIENLSKKYKDNMILDNVSMVIENGKKVLIKGPNGVGKSVLLKLIVGYSTADSGIIKIDDYILKKDYDFINGSGVSINNPEFNKNLSGFDNLCYLAKIRKIASEDKIKILVDYFNMNDIIHKKYRNYSLGTKQKLRIIQAVMDSSKYLILDEPFDALDKKSQKLAIELFNTYLKINKDASIIYTTHNETFHEGFADEIYEIDDSKLIKVK